MALNGRDTTYVANVTQVKSADLNQWQDDISALNAGKRPRTYQRRVSVTGGRETAGVFTNGGYAPNNNGDSLVVPFAVEEGERLLTVTARVQGQASFGTGQVTMTIRKCTDGSVSNIGSDISSITGTPETVTADTDEEVDSGNATYEAVFTFTGALPLAVYSVVLNVVPA